MRTRIALLVVLAVATAAGRADAQAGRAPSMREVAREVALEWTSRAAAAERAGQPVEAEADYARAMEADAGFLPPHLGYARLLAARGHGDEARRVLDQIPSRAIVTERDAVEIAQMRNTLGDTDGALDMLASRGESAEATRARVELAASVGRFPEALLSARHLADLTRGTEHERDAALLVRALAIVVGEADAVRAPGATSSALRRILAQ